MTQRTFIKCLRVQSQKKEELRLEYYLLTDYASFDGANLDLYGVEVVSYQARRPKPEICRIRGITPIGSQILQLLQRLIEGAVTPTTLREVVDDELARQSLPDARRPVRRKSPGRR